MAISSTTQDGQLARVITAVSRRLDLLVGPVVTRTITNEPHAFATTIPWSSRDTIELEWCPVTSITTVTNYLGTTATVLTAQTAGTSPANGYYAETYKPNPTLLSGIIERKTGLYRYPFGDLVTVTYVAGRYADTASVDPMFKEAASYMLRNSWRAYQQSTAPYQEFEVPQQTFPTYFDPNVVLELLANDVKPKVGFG